MTGGEGSGVGLRAGWLVEALRVYSKLKVRWLSVEREDAKGTHFVVSGREVTVRDGSRSDKSRLEGVHDDDKAVIAGRAG